MIISFLMQNFLTFRTVLSCTSVAIFTFTFTTSSSRLLLPMTVVWRVIKNRRAGKSLYLTSMSHNQDGKVITFMTVIWQWNSKYVVSKQIPVSRHEMKFVLFDYSNQMPKNQYDRIRTKYTFVPYSWHLSLFSCPGQLYNWHCRSLGRSQLTIRT